MGFVDCRGHRGFSESQRADIAFQNPNETIGFHHSIFKLRTRSWQPTKPTNQRTSTNSAKSAKFLGIHDMLWM
eukprot:8354701-Pyramimonas_sp.AAC.1